jgi:cytoskeletal protein CcmA (bactofilin family)
VVLLFGKHKNAVAQKVETLVGKETALNGTLQSRGSVRIDGTFQGEINSQGDLIIGEGALVKACVNCSNIIVAGRLEGNVFTKGKLELRNTGVLVGDAEVGTLSVEEGAVMLGNCKMKTSEDGRALAKNGGASLKREIPVQRD